ncbi:hypothetical protein [Bacillus thuringiensis]|uniref:hypothetical protein n=1 Tax=Bacillus thuringiensis TaxID=1428 RepID=UPI001A90872E|nr:hypothetical protein [Bacillus thuringiensis]
MFFKLLVACPSYSIYRGLKVPQGTGRIFFRYATENLHLLGEATPLRYITIPILAKLFSARVVSLPSRQTKKEILFYQLDLQVYVPNRFTIVLTFLLFYFFMT